AEELEVEPEAAVRLQMNDLAHGVEEGCAPIGGEPHHLVIVAIVRKAEILRKRLIKHAERMREIHAALDIDLAVRGRAPGGAGEIAKAIHRDDACLFKG